MPHGGHATVGNLAQTGEHFERIYYPLVSADGEGIPPGPLHVSEGIPGEGELVETRPAASSFSDESIEEMIGFKEENDSDGSFSETDDGVEWEVVHR
jgi:hypothetical protein